MYNHLWYNTDMKKVSEFQYIMGLRLRAYPSNKQRKGIFLNSRAKDYIYNKCVAINTEIWQLNKVKIYCGPVQDRLDFLNTLRNDYRQIANMAPFLNDPLIDSMAGANAIANYNKAWKMFKKVSGTAVPAFRKKTNRYSYQTNPHYGKSGKITGVHFEDATHIVLPKLGKIRVKGDPAYVHRMLSNTERFGTFTVTLEPDGSCYISVQLASDTPFMEKYKETGSEAGIDANVKNLISVSDGTVIDNPKYLTKAEKKLKKAQRKLSRKTEHAEERCPEDMKLRDYLKTCREYQRQRSRTAHIHEHVKNQRRNNLHNVTNDLVKSHDTIVSEDLKVKNLLKNHRLARSVSDVSWGEMFRMLDYKAAGHGKTYIKVPPQYTTQTCSSCGNVLEEEKRLGLNEREWTCPVCGAHHDRDINSAKNILNKGISLLKK